jgi:stage IV sporulation protein B
MKEARKIVHNTLIRKRSWKDVFTILKKWISGIDINSKTGDRSAHYSRNGKSFVMLTIIVVLVLLTTSARAAGWQESAQIPKEVIPLGRTAGIKMSSDGVLVVGISKVATEKGEKSPAGDAGMKPGDIIIEINRKKITSVEDLRDAVQSKNRLNLKYLRDGKVGSCQIQPLKSSDDGTMKLGAWVRDSMAGIGTLTFYDPKTRIFGALGHGINDVDTSSLMPLASGALIYSRVDSVRPGEAGSPGELYGMFDAKKEFGTLFANTEFGVFGEMDVTALMPLELEAFPVAAPGEVQAGKATILANVDGETVESYDIKIKKIYPADRSSIRDMTIEIIDSRLLARTGGIVQGMSGSPIIQDGKIVGAVTHVLINEPSQGYGIFIHKMLHAAYNSRNN